MQKNKKRFDGIVPSKNPQKPVQSGKSQPAKKMVAFVSDGGKQGQYVNHSNNLKITKKKQTPIVPEIGKKGALKIIPLGGQEEVGRNMTIFEYEKDIIILDMGMQFPEEDMPGIDYIIPNISYLKGREKNIRGVVFSHGHLDHIGAAPILLQKLNYPPVIGRDFTIALVKKKLDDYEKNSAQRLKVMKINSIKDTFKLGKFEISFFDVEHSIMDAVGVILKTPEGTVIHPGDWTMEKDDSGKSAVSYDHLKNLPSPKILMLESLGAIVSNPDRTTEKEMYANLEKLISEASGKVIIGTFSSQIRRVGHILEYAQKIGKKVALDGYSIKTNIEIAKELGYIKMHKETLINVKDIHNYPDNKVVVVCTGAQGEENASLSRIITDNHRFIKIKKNDTVIFSSSVIPGNERTIQRLKDNLYRKCDNVIHTDIMDVHTSGHCSLFDIQDMLRQVRPDFFVPVYANHYMLKEAAKVAMNIGFPKERIFILDNGSVLDVHNRKGSVIDKKIDTSYVFVDGLGVGDVGHVVLRDRQVLSADGMFVINIILDTKNKKVLGNIQVTSRGFIYVKDNFDLVNETKRKVLKVIKDSTSKSTSVDRKFIENSIRDTIGQFLFTKTQRRPMVLPVIIEV